jgi:hypothetical protein
MQYSRNHCLQLPCLKNCILYHKPTVFSVTCSGKIVINLVKSKKKSKKYILVSNLQKVLVLYKMSVSSLILLRNTVFFLPILVT